MPYLEKILQEKLIRNCPPFLYHTFSKENKNYSKLTVPENPPKTDKSLVTLWSDALKETHKERTNKRESWVQQSMALSVRTS